MTRTNKILQSLNAGELSPLMDCRIDQEKYQMGCRTMENFYPLIYGGAERRPGTYFTGIAKSSSLKCRLIDFVYSTDIAYVLEFGNQYMRVFVNSGRFVGALLASTTAWATAISYYAGDFVSASSVIYRCIIAHTSDTAGGNGTGGTPAAAANATQWAVADLTSDLYPIYEIPTPYLTADLFQLKFEHSADVTYITHSDYEPRKLSRINSTTFVLEECNYHDGPFQTQNTATTALITPSATTGSITLTASGTNADGTTFAPFVDGTTAGHEPSGTTGAAAVGTSQTLKSITGALFKIVHSTDAATVAKSFTAIGTSDSVKVYKGFSGVFTTNGFWTGTIKLERSYDEITWETQATVTSEQNNNEAIDFTEEVDTAWYRMEATVLTAGSANCQISVNDTSIIGIVEITAVTSTTVATATVIDTLGAITATYRWSEGYWSNYRGWPISVAISAEERLTFAGSPGFPLTVWGSVSGEYNNMTAGVLDNDAIIYTLVGSGNQSAIRWIVSKNALIIGTYGGEHLLGATDDKESLSPTNVQAKIQSTYGSEDIQAVTVGDCILFVQRGGRRLREMHYDFEKDSMIAEDLTVFANHITESKIKWMAYQRTPDPMLWCGLDNGEIAVLSYERSQDVWSWCRLITCTSNGAVDSDFESGCVIPTSGEEDQVWVSVRRTIGSADVRYIEYFSTRSF